MKDNLYQTINELRLLVFTETEPQSNKYYQVILTPEEYTKVSLSFGRKTGKILYDDVEEVDLTVSTEEYTLPDLRPFKDNKKPQL